MRRAAICGQPMRRYETPRRGGVPDYLTCGRRPGHPGRHESTIYVRARAGEKQATGSPALAAALREARERAGLSQRRLAAAVGVSRSAVQRWEEAARTPAPENWVQLELALGPLGIIRRQTATEETAMRDDPAELIYPGADDGGWDPLAVRELDDAVRLGDLASRMLRVSARLAAAVANRDRDTIGRIINSLTPEPVSEDVAALLVAQAGVIAGLARHENRTADEALDWIDFDEHGRRLPAPGPEPAGLVAQVIPITADQAAQHRADLEQELRERARGRRHAA